MVLGTTYKGTCANGRRPEELPLGNAKSICGFEEHHIFICEGVAPLEPGDPPYQAAVLDHDAFRFSGRAGRVEDVGEVFRFWRSRLMVRIHPFERPRAKVNGVELVGRNDPFRRIEGVQLPLPRPELDDVS